MANKKKEVAQTAPAVEVAQTAPAVEVAQTAPVAKRKVTTTAMRYEAIKAGMPEADSNGMVSLAVVNALLAKNLTVSKGSTGSKAVAPKVDAQGKPVYHCVRSDKWFYLEDMVVNAKDNSNRGYSKASHDELVKATASMKEFDRLANEALLDGKFEEAKSHADNSNTIKKMKEDKTLYAGVVGTAVPVG